MELKIVHGDLLEQPVEAIVNAWNQNILPSWLLRPHGVSGAIKRRAGPAPFRALRRYGRLTSGQAVWTSAGRLSYRGIIHVATISPWGRAQAAMLPVACANIIACAKQHAVASLALPLLGTGSGGLDRATVRELLITALQQQQYAGQVLLVEYAD